MKIEYEVVMQTARCATFDAVQFVNRKIECSFLSVALHLIDG